jgi:hypothetical protein
LVFALSLVVGFRLHEVKWRDADPPWSCRSAAYGIVAEMGIARTAHNDVRLRKIHSTRTRIGCDRFNSLLLQRTLIFRWLRANCGDSPRFSEKLA